jgi:hypothetical protein
VAYDRELPGGDRTAELFAEVARLEEEHRRRDAVAQGERQIEELIRQGRADQAELALKVLLRIDPKHKKRRQLEKKIKAMAR